MIGFKEGDTKMAYKEIGIEIDIEEAKKKYWNRFHNYELPSPKTDFASGKIQLDDYIWLPDDTCVKFVGGKSDGKIGRVKRFPRRTPIGHPDDEKYLTKIIPVNFVGNDEFFNNYFDCPEWNKNYVDAPLYPAPGWVDKYSCDIEYFQIIDYQYSEIESWDYVKLHFPIDNKIVYAWRYHDGRWFTDMSLNSKQIVAENNINYPLVTKIDIKHIFLTKEEIEKILDNPPVIHEETEKYRFAPNEIALYVFTVLLMLCEIILNGFIWAWIGTITVMLIIRKNLRKKYWLN